MNGMTSHNITHGIYSQNRIRTALHRIVWRRAPHLTCKKTVHISPRNNVLFGAGSNK